MLPKPINDQLPEDWNEYHRNEPEHVTFRDDSDEFAVDIRQGRAYAGTYNIRVRGIENAIADGEEIAETAAANKEIALATAVGFMELAARLQQSYLS